MPLGSRTVNDYKRRYCQVKALTYPPIPTHALSRRAISRLQKIQNAALRFVFTPKWDEFITMEALHQEASLLPLNLTLHAQARKVWLSLEAEGGEQFRALQDLHRDAPESQHNWFPRSLLHLQQPDPPPQYL